MSSITTRGGGGASLLSSVSKGRFSSLCAGTPAGSPLHLRPYRPRRSSPSQAQGWRWGASEDNGGILGELNNACRFVLAYLQFFVGEVLPQLFGHPLQVLEGDPARFVVVEQAESLEDFLF